MAMFYSYKTTFHNGREEFVGEEYKVLDTHYHLEFHCNNGNGSKNTKLSDKKDIMAEITHAKAKGFIPSDTLPKGVPSMKKFARPRIIEGVPGLVRVVLNTPFDPTKR